MLYGLVSPVKRSGSSIPQFVRRIPADLRDRAVGMHLDVPLGDSSVPVVITAKTDSIRFSLRTRDPSEAKVRQAEALAYIEQAFRALRANVPVSLTRQQATALAGQLYRSWANGEGHERKKSITLTDGGWVEDDDDFDDEEELVFAATIAYLDRINADGESEDLEPLLGAIVDRLLLAKGIAAVDVPSRRLLLSAFWLALRDAMELRRRNAAGDYTPDPKSERFPEWKAPGRPAEASPATKVLTPAKVTLSGLVDAWWRESEAAGMKPSTHESYGNTMTKFVGFLGHDDATRVTPDDVVAFKDHRLSTPHPRTGKPASARTVKDADLAGLKSVFNWAVRNRKLPANPAAGITIKLGKQAKLRETGFTDEEVKSLLSACLRLERGQERPEAYAAKRWIPWLLAYTGARIGEIAQLRKQDVQKIGDHWTIRITPEAGTVKGNETRLVPLHPHLVEIGFPEFSEAASAGHLFMRPNGKTGDVLGPLKGVKNHLREFVREYITDPNVQPNHAWRHLFITRSRAAGVDQEIRRMITGHTGEGVDEKVYGEPAGLYREIAKLPRFVI
jgi:integrase